MTTDELKSVVHPYLAEICSHQKVLVFDSQSMLDETIKNENYDIMIDSVLDILEALISFTIDGGLTKEMHLLLSSHG